MVRIQYFSLLGLVRVVMLLMIAALMALGVPLQQAAQRRSRDTSPYRPLPFRPTPFSLQMSRPERNFLPKTQTRRSPLRVSPRSCLRS
jgi:hypothetical protein